MTPGSPTSSVLSSSYTAGVSIDDPDVRLAAEALGDLATNGGDSKKAEFLSRLSTYPVVSSALKSYENSKTKSKLLNYGAGMVESVARPLVSQLEPLDSFACRQLDRIEGKYAIHVNEGNGEKASGLNKGAAIKVRTNNDNKSKWHNVLISTSGLASSMSDESVRSLRYVLSVLKYANSQIDRAVKSLRTILTQYENSEAKGGMLEAKRERMISRVATIKRDILRTVQWVVEGIGQYTGSSLPEHARNRVREYVLGLPSRWVEAASITTPLGGLVNSRRKKPEAEVGNNAQQEGTYRLLKAALETLDVLESVAKVVHDTIDSAESWYVYDECTKLIIGVADLEDQNRYKCQKRKKC
jgi:hypothetical protein